MHESGMADRVENRGARFGLSKGGSSMKGEAA